MVETGRCEKQHHYAIMIVCSNDFEVCTDSGSFPETMARLTIRNAENGNQVFLYEVVET